MNPVKIWTGNLTDGSFIPSNIQMIVIRMSGTELYAHEYGFRKEYIGKVLKLANKWLHGSVMTSWLNELDRFWPGWPDGRHNFGNLFRVKAIQDCYHIPSNIFSLKYSQKNHHTKTWYKNHVIIILNGIFRCKLLHRASKRPIGSDFWSQPTMF